MGGNFCKQQIAPLAGAAVHDLAPAPRQALADARNVGDLARGVAQDVLDALGVALDGRGAVAVAANAEGILAGDLHQIGRLPQHARDFLVLQAGPSIQL